MQFGLPFGEDPACWVTHGGHPASCLGVRGLPSFEAGGRKLVVFEPLVVVRQAGGSVMFFPVSYPGLSYQNRDGFVSPHPKVKSTTEWRPCLYEMALGGIEGRSSQQELEWRKVTGDFVSVTRTMDKLDIIDAENAILSEMVAAKRRAERTMISCLSPQQRIEYLSHRRGFRVRGGATGRLYGIELGNGFCSLDRVTNAVKIGYCLHPEYWIPDADIALATKLALEDPELELECLENAGRGERSRARRKVRPEDLKASELERELIK